MNKLGKIYLSINHEFVPYEYHDISLANRLGMWETSHYLSFINGYTHNLYLPKHFYSDVENLIFFPNTYFYDEKEFNPLDYNDTIHPITENQTPTYYNGQNILAENKDYVLDWHCFMGVHQCGVKDIKQFFRDHITFHSYILRQVQLQTQNMCAIHVRRGDGVDYPIEFYENLSLKSKNYSKRGMYKFYDDEEYFKIIDKILEINKNQIFYLAHDLEDVDFSHWKDRYPDKIFTNNDIFYNLYDHFFNYEKHILDAVIDICTLYESNIKILNPESTFSEFARNQPKHDVLLNVSKNLFFEKITYVIPDGDVYKDNLEIFLSEYKKYTSKILSTNA